MIISSKPKPKFGNFRGSPLQDQEAELSKSRPAPGSQAMPKWLAKWNVLQAKIYRGNK